MYDAPGFEADDIIGTIVHDMRRDQKDLRVVIATGDMDTLQLVSGDDVTVFTLRKGIEDTVVYDEQAVRDRFSFGPEHVTDYKGFRGDPSDNIPGVKGVGEKTAGILISTCGTLEKVYETLKNSPEILKKAGITDRISKILLEHEEDAVFSKTLATIRTDAPIKFSLPEHFPGSVDKKALHDFFDHYELRALKTRWDAFLSGKKTEPTQKEALRDGGTGRKQEPLVPGAFSSEDIRRLGIMLWVTDSEKTIPDEEDIVSSTKAITPGDAEKILLSKLESEHVMQIWEEIEKPLIPVVRKMEERGIRIDTEFLHSYQKELEGERDRLVKQIHSYSGNELNINSPKQLAVFLFETLKLPSKGSRGKAGSFSTKSDILEGLLDEHPVVAAILEYREIEKLLTTYVSVFPTLVGVDGKLHTTLYQHGTTTGRFSSSDPNLQNIPIRTPRGAQMRKAFVASPGHVLLSADYSQVELRVAAFLSGDEALLDVFRSGRDVHTETAARMMNILPENVTQLMRRQAKVINFGVLYGMGVVALQKNLGVSRAEAVGFLEAYKNSYPKLISYLESVKESAKKDGCTETFFGRKRRIPLIKSSLPYLRAQGERMAINAPIQGTAADMMKLALIFVTKDLSDTGMDSHIYPILQIHDELLFEVEDGQVEKAIELIRNAMEPVFSRSFLKTTPPISFPVEVKAGDSWGSMEFKP
jgi:DNA polymerase-1